jgi:small nuclear ribonucleoprotein (snRNP)-like protein
MIDDPTQRSLQTLADPVQIKVQDGRVLVGDFACMDKQGNIILYNAVEELLVDGA